MYEALYDGGLAEFVALSSYVQLTVPGTDPVHSAVLLEPLPFTVDQDVGDATGARWTR